MVGTGVLLTIQEPPQGSADPPGGPVSGPVTAQQLTAPLLVG